MKLKSDFHGRGWVAVAASLGLIVAVSVTIAPFLFKQTEAAPKAKRIVNFFGPVTLIQGQSLRLDAAYLACAAKDCAQQVELTMSATVASQKVVPLTPQPVLLKANGVATHTLSWDQIPGDGEKGRKTVLGVIQVASADGRDISTAGVTATAHLVDAATGGVDVALPLTQRLCGDLK